MKLAAAALSLVLLVPGLAQSQPLAPPRLLYPGESPPSVPPPTSTPGTYPSPTEPLGYQHPECLAVYGKTPAQIEATPCGITEKVAANSTVSACTHNGIIDFQGDNITIDCVKMTTGAVAFGTRCVNTNGCKNLIIRRSTLKGNNGAQIPPASSANDNKLIRLTAGGGGPFKTILIEKNDLSESDQHIYIGSGPNGDALGFPGEGDKAVVIRGNRIHHQSQTCYGTTCAHTEGLYIAESARGVLFENNLVDATGTNPSYNWGAMIQVQVSDANAGNYVFRNNHIITDTTGVALNFGSTYHPENPNLCTCASPQWWVNNRVDLKSDSLFNYSGHCPAGCPTLGSSSCTGNTFENGSPQTCNSNGL